MPGRDQINNKSDATPFTKTGCPISKRQQEPLISSTPSLSLSTASPILRPVYLSKYTKYKYANWFWMTLHLLLTVFYKNSYSCLSFNSGLKAGLYWVHKNFMISVCKWFYRGIFSKFFVAWLLLSEIYIKIDMKNLYWRRCILIVPLLLLWYNKSIHIRYWGIQSCYWCNRPKKTLQTDTKIHSQAEYLVRRILNILENSATKVNDHWPLVVYM